MNYILFGVKVDDTAASERFFIERNAFLKNVHNVAKNPYVGAIDRQRCKEGSKYTFILEPVFPRVYFLGIPYLLLYLVLSNFSLNGWIIPGIIMSSTYLLFCPLTYYWGCRLGLRKVGYSGKCLLIIKKKSLTPSLNRFIEGKTAL